MSEVKIKTKFDVGDEIYYISEKTTNNTTCKHCLQRITRFKRTVKKDHVRALNFYIDNREVIVSCLLFKTYMQYLEKKIYKTKEEARKVLKESEGK
jgi:hypothetical protein